MKIPMRWLAFVLAAMLSGITPAMAIAGPPQSNPYGDDAPSHARGPIVGTITGVDYGAGRIRVNARGRNLWLIITPGTAIYRGGAYAALTDLQNGMHVEASVNEVDGNLIAQIIRIH